MKSEHRHELKTNELAEWLGNLPQWIKENLTTILVVIVVVVVGLTFFFWRSYNKNVVQAREHIEFSNLMNQLTMIEARIPGAQTQGGDPSVPLLQAAQTLGSFAQSTSNSQMAALALIKQAEAERAQLHYSTVELSQQDKQKQINQAKTAYTEAVQKSSGNAAIRAAAEFGLGLCDEELGNFDQAKKIYQAIVANADYDGTVAKASAKDRLKIMDDYREEVVFKPAPIPAAASQPTIQLNPVDANSPANTDIPININQQPLAPVVSPELNSKVPEPNDSGK
jgi:tetratricopeptide (TPR) repeat protein